MVLAPSPPAPGSLDSAADRLARLLVAGGSDLSDGLGREPSGRSAIEFVGDLGIRPLARGAAPSDVWAVDGGQALVADARCLQVLVTRAARVRFRASSCVLEDEGELRAHLLGGAQSARAAAASLDLDGLPADVGVDVNLLRDRWEWDAVARSVDEADPGALVLVDGDLVPDWRIPSWWLDDLLARASQRGIVLAGITKHSSLARGGAPLLGQLEVEAEGALGPRSLWWAPIGRVRSDVGAGLQVVAARLDADARFAFRVDLPGDVDAELVLAQLAAVSDDAGFPGYPYPLTVADRLAACPSWLREEVRMQLDDLLERAGVPYDVRQRAFADRHNLMERF